MSWKMREKAMVNPRLRVQFALPVRKAGRFLVVSCGDLNVALPAGQVRNILRPEDAGDARGDSTWQAIYRPIDLAARLEQRPVEDGPDNRIILFGKFDEHSSFKVAVVQGIVNLEAREIRPLPPHFTGEERRWFTGLFLFQDTVALLVNLDWLLDRQADDRWLGERAGTEVLELEIASDGDDAPWAES